MMAVAGERVLRPDTTLARAGARLAFTGSSPKPETSARRLPARPGCGVIAWSSASRAADRISNAAAGSVGTNFRRAAPGAPAKDADTDKGNTDIGAEGMNQRGNHLSLASGPDQRRVSHVGSIT